jgi:hypothetical protein
MLDIAAKRRRCSRMTLKTLILAGVATILLGVTRLDAAQPGTCDRACLTDIVESYLAAMLAHDPTKLPLARNARYTENGVELPLPDGLWRTLQSVEKYRLIVADPRESTIGFFVKAVENGAPVLVATRLRLADHRITEIESIASRLSATVGGGPSGLTREDHLGESTRAQFVTPLPVHGRHSREQLARIVNTYFTGIENNTGDKPPPFASDCLRLENGTQTTGRPLAAGAEPGPLNFGCSEAFRLGYYHEDTRLRNRRVLALDEERGLVYTGVFLDHDATIRSYKLKDGRTVTVRNTAPWTWMAHEVFQVNGSGQLSQVEAVLLSVPYGMRPGWSTGQHLPSPAAQRDGFKEY